MDVERIQRVNNLALDLMKQGLAPDREEAIRQAEKIYSGQTEDYDAIREGIAKVESDVKPKEEVKKEEPSPNLSQDQIKNILEQNTKFLVKTINQFQEKVSSMEKEIQSLKSQLAYNKIPSAGQILTKETVKVEETAEQPVKKETTEKQPHPRMGDYSDEDVSVEKFFYMGNG